MCGPHRALQSYPCPLLAIALWRAGYAPCLANTVEWVLMEKAWVKETQEYESRRAVPDPDHGSIGRLGSKPQLCNTVKLALEV